MLAGRNCWSIGSNLRTKCFVIGYLNLIAILVSIGLHVVTVYILSRGFKCDETKISLFAAQWYWKELFLLIINLGTHGFYSYPLTFNYYIYQPRTIDNLPIPDSQASCYEGKFHVNVSDVMYLLINIFWLKFVLAFLIGIHKKNPKQIRVFFTATIIKLTVQVLNLSTQSDYNNVFVTLLCKFADIALIVLSLIVINKYIIELCVEKANKTMNKPPAYIECLINGPPTRVDEKKDAVYVIEDKKAILSEEKKEEC